MLVSRLETQEAPSLEGSARVQGSGKLPFCDNCFDNCSSSCGDDFSLLQLWCFYFTSWLRYVNLLRSLHILYLVLYPLNTLASLPYLLLFKDDCCRKICVDNQTIVVRIVSQIKQLSQHLPHKYCRMAGEHGCAGFQHRGFESTSCPFFVWVSAYAPTLHSKLLRILPSLRKLGPAAPGHPLEKLLHSVVKRTERSSKSHNPHYNRVFVASNLSGLFSSSNSTIFSSISRISA